MGNPCQNVVVSNNQKRFSTKEKPCVLSHKLTTLTGLVSLLWSQTPEKKLTTPLHLLTLLLKQGIIQDLDIVRAHLVTTDSLLLSASSGDATSPRHDRYHILSLLTPSKGDTPEKLSGTPDLRDIPIDMCAEFSHTATMNRIIDSKAGGRLIALNVVLTFPQQAVSAWIRSKADRA